MVIKAKCCGAAERDPEAVRGFLMDQGDAIAARTRRETLHKLDTGLKNPRRHHS